MRYRTAYERNKFLAASSHVHRGQILRDGGKLDEAKLEFEKALAIDASSFIAQQELKRTIQMIQEAQNPQPQAENARGGELHKMLSQARGPIDLAPISNAPITLKLTEKSNVIYETVGKLAGVNVLFDPDYTPKQVRIELNGVTLEEALSIVSFETKTFWRPITPNTIFVAQDNPAKRKELEQNVLKTFYLSNLSQPTELQDVVNAMRTILEVSRIQQLPSQGAIVVRGTPDQVALAQKLVDDLDKAKAEVLIDVAVMEVSRDKMKNLGISPPTNVSVALQPNVNTTSTTSTGSTGGVSTSTNGQTTTGVTLNTLDYLNATDFQVTIPPASATALLSDSTSKIIQNPQVRALDGQKATLKIGERVPVATGSFQPGIGGVGINPLVNTQFQYIDVGVNIDITPRVHANREISMKLTLDVSAVTSYVSIGGISQPVIGQRKVEHEIRLKDGEVNLLGGIMEDQQTKALTGIPGLAQIPILKYLFSQTNTEHQQDEIVFVLTPHIIRGIEEPPGSRDVLDVGTANSIELRRTTSKIETVPATQTPATQPTATPPQGAVAPNPGMAQPNQAANNQAGAQMPGGPGARNGGARPPCREFACPDGGRKCSRNVPVRSSGHDAGQGFNVYRERHVDWRAKRLLGAGAIELRSHPIAGHQRIERRLPVAGWTGGRAGASRRSSNRNSTGDRDPASGGGRRFGPGIGCDVNLHGQVAGPIGVDHYTGRRARSGHAADRYERRPGCDHDSVNRDSLNMAQ